MSKNLLQQTWDLSDEVLELKAKLTRQEEVVMAAGYYVEQMNDENEPTDPLAWLRLVNALEEADERS